MTHTLTVEDAVEDEFTSRMILNTLLLPLGPCDIARKKAALLAKLSHLRLVW
jgi:hypothetical protein